MKMNKGEETRLNEFKERAERFADSTGDYYLLRLAEWTTGSGRRKQPRVLPGAVRRINRGTEIATVAGWFENNPRNQAVYCLHEEPVEVVFSGGQSKYGNLAVDYMSVFIDEKEFYVESGEISSEMVNYEILKGKMLEELEEEGIPTSRVRFPYDNQEEE